MIENVDRRHESRLAAITAKNCELIDTFPPAVRMAVNYAVTPLRLDLIAAWLTKFDEAEVLRAIEEANETARRRAAMAMAKFFIPTGKPS